MQSHSVTSSRHLSLRAYVKFALIFMVYFAWRSALIIENEEKLSRLGLSFKSYSSIVEIVHVIKQRSFLSSQRQHCQEKHFSNVRKKDPASGIWCENYMTVFFAWWAFSKAPLTRLTRKNQQRRPCHKIQNWQQKGGTVTETGTHVISQETTPSTQLFL